jgi:formamidopyrimidine-DNA glycosylase
VPELPEVETVVRDLRLQLTGRALAAVWIGPHRLRRHWREGWERLLVGRRVKDLRRRGKWIIIELSGRLHLVVHLGMTGQLTVQPRAAALEPHTHVVVDLKGRPEQLRFRDVRRFGSISLFDGKSDLERFFKTACLGPEPLEVDSNYWRQCLAKTRRCLKAVLLDQRVVAGVGNIYADESLFEARLHPALPAKETTRAQAERLRKAIAHVLERAVRLRGSSIRDYIGGSGLKGQYQKEFRVYGQPGQPCMRCRRSIERIRLAGRSTHYCPRCQPMPS